MTTSKATSHMIDESASAGFFTSEHFGKFTRIQILTVEDLLAGKTVDLPPNLQTYKQAGKVTVDEPNQFGLDFS